MKVLAAFAFAAVLVTGANATPVIDVVEFPTGFFVDDESNTYKEPFYRWDDDDWGWSHNAISTTSFSSATLSISAFDVDAVTSYYSPEVDEIFVKDDGSWVSIGNLNGVNDEYSYTTFVLGSEFYNEIETGLEVRMDIDKNNSGWAVTLAKSVVSLDAAPIPDPDPDPTSVPEPASAALLLMGLGSLIGFKVRRK